LKLAFFRYPLLLTVLSLAYGGSFAQSDIIKTNSKIDSLQRLVDKRSGTEKADLLNTLAFEWFNFNYEKANEKLTEALDLSKKLDYTSGMGEALIYKGIYQRLIGHLRLANKYFDEGIILSREANNKGIEGYGLQQYATVMLALGKKDSALLLYKQSYSVLRDSLHPRMLSHLYKSWSKYYSQEQDLKMEKEYLLRSLGIREQLKDASLMILSYTELATYYSKNNLNDEAMRYILKAELLFPSAKTVEGSYALKYAKAVILIKQSRLKDALKIFNELKEYNLFNLSLRNQLEQLIQFGTIFYNSSSYEISLVNYYEALKIAEQNNYVFEQATILQRIGSLYNKLNQSQLAEDFAKRCIAVSRANGFKTEEATALNLLGLAFSKRNMYDSAMKFFQQALSMRQQIGDPIRTASTTHNLGELLEKKGALSEALGYFERALTIEQSANDLLGIAEQYRCLGQVYIKTGNFVLAQENLNKAEETLKRIEIEAKKEFLVNLFKNQSDLFKVMNRNDMALLYFQKYHHLKDSLLNTSITSRLVGLQSQYEISERNQRIELLNKDKTLQQNQIGQQQTIIFTIFGGSILLAILGIVLYQNYKSVKKLNKDINAQSEEIKSKSEEIQTQAEELKQQNEELDQRVRDKTVEIRNIFERVSDGFIALNKNWCFTFVNTKGEELFNKPNEYLLGKEIWIEFPEFKGQPFKLECEKAMETQQYQHSEDYNRTSNRWFENHIYPSAFGCSIYIRDITKRRLAEKEKDQALYLQNERHKELTTLLGASQILQAQLPIEQTLQKIVDILPGGLQYSDLAAARIRLGQMDYKTSNFRDSKHKLTSTIKTDYGAHGLVEIVYKEDDQYNITESSFFKEEKEVVETVADMLRIFLTRLHAESSLRESEATLSATINNTEVLIWSVDRNYDLVMFNQPFAAYMKKYWNSEIQISKKILESRSAKEKEMTEWWQQNYLKALAGEAVTVSKSEFGLDYQYSLSPIIAGGFVIGVSIFGNDITERNAREHELMEANKKIGSLQLMALRSVMSPHFIFNVLNSIQFFITRNDRLNAINYLSTFSKLIRSVLTYSVNHKIKLTDEIEMLKNYVHLEMLRFENKFNFVLEVDPGLDIDFIELPSLLIQPYVENAILHGLYNKVGHGTLAIRIKEEKELLVLEVEDDGIGRAAAMKLKLQSISSHKSMGIKITEERLKLINLNQTAELTIEDLTNDLGPCGTKATIKISY
jgi:PAS domain S-box-containing protein